jgi:hypothetical protein
MAAVEPCTTWSVRKQHWSDCLSDQTGSLKGLGRRNITLCGMGGAMGQAVMERRRRPKRPTLITDLPECKPCARAKEKM